MNPLAMLLKGLALGGETGVEWPVVPSAPVLKNWGLLYDRQAPKGSTTAIQILTTKWWLDYLYPTDVITITGDRPVTWLYWNQSAQTLYVNGSVSDAPIGATTRVTLTSTDSHGSSNATIGITIVDATMYNKRPILTAGLSGFVSASAEDPSHVGDTVVTVTANKTVTQWDIVSGNPTVDGVSGFTINSAGVVSVANPALFIDDPFILNDTYVLTVRAIDTNGIYGFVDVEVPVSGGRINLVGFRYIKFLANDTTWNTTWGLYRWNQPDIGLYTGRDLTGTRLIPVAAYASSTYDSDHVAAYAFDSTDATSWATVGNPTTPEYVVADLGMPIIIRSIRFYPDTTSTMFPKSMKILVSNNNVDWTLLTTVNLPSGDTYPKALNIQ